MSDQEETENRWKHDIIWFRSQIWYDIIIWYEISNRRWCLHNFKVALTLYHMQGGLLETLSIDFFTGKVKQIKSTVRLFDLLASKPRETQSKKKKKVAVEQTLTLEETLYQICLGFEIGVFSAFVISFHW